MEIYYNGEKIEDVSCSTIPVFDEEYSLSWAEDMWQENLKNF